MQFISSLSTPAAYCTPMALTQAFDYRCQCPELWVILDGSFTISYGKDSLCNRIVTAGETIFFLPDTEFSVLPSDVVLLQISFIPEQFWALFKNPSVAFHPVLIQDNHQLFQYCLHYGKFLLEITFKSPAHGAALLTQVLCQLDAMCTPPESVILNPALSAKQNELLHAILQYVNTHYTESISLADTASALCITPQYLASFFKKAMECTLMKYVQDVRSRMEQLWKTTPHPSTYPLSQHALTFPQVFPYMKRYATFTATLEEPQPQYQIAEADTAYKQNFPHSWKKLVNLGYASDFSNIQLLHQLIQVQKDIGFAYGRICRIFDLITEYSLDNQTIYDYSRIFRILDVMIEHKMLPFIEVSNKIFRIQLTLLENVPLNMGTDVIDYYNHLLMLLPDFIRACINRYGQECFNQWRFEISYNNYDFMENAENFSFHKYMRYFQKIYAILRSFSLSCKIGGPGFNQWDNPKKLEDILELFHSYQIEPDFITAYVYPLINDGSKAALSPDEDLSLKRIQFLRNVLSTQHKNKELWITEFNSNLSARNLLNDSSYQAVFLSKLLTASAHMDIEAMGYYLLSDIPLRYADTLDMFFGGWGLLTDNDLPKPSYHAYCMFSMLGHRLLQYHENYLITAKSDSSFQCFFYHYEHIKPEYFQKNILRQDLEGFHLFLKKDAQHWDVTIKQVPPGTYLRKEYTLSETEGNLLALWKQLSFASFSKEPDMYALRLRSRLQPKLSLLNVGSDQILSFPLDLIGHQVKLILIDFNHNQQE